MVPTESGFNTPQCYGATGPSHTPKTEVNLPETGMPGSFVPRPRASTGDALDVPS